MQANGQTSKARLRLFSHSALTGPHRPGIRWEFYSARLQRRLSGNGSLSRDYFVRLECCPSVATFLPWYESAEGYISEARVTYVDGSVELHEVYARGNAEPSTAQSEAEVRRHIRADQVRCGTQLLPNYYAMIPWLSRNQQTSPLQRAVVLGMLSGHDHPQPIELLAKACEISLADLLVILATEYTKGHVLITDVRTRPWGRDSLILHASRASYEKYSKPL